MKNLKQHEDNFANLCNLIAPYAIEITNDGEKEVLNDIIHETIFVKCHDSLRWIIGDILKRSLYFNIAEIYNIGECSYGIEANDKRSDFHVVLFNDDYKQYIIEERG